MFEGTIPAADAKPVCHAGDVETMKGIIDDTLLTHSDNNGKPTFKRRLQSPIHPHVPRKPYGRFRNAGEPTAPQGTPVEIGDSLTLRTCWLTPS